MHDCTTELDATSDVSPCLTRPCRLGVALTNGEPTEGPVQNVLNCKAVSSFGGRAPSQQRREESVFPVSLNPSSAESKGRRVAQMNRETGVYRCGFRQASCGRGH